MLIDNRPSEITYEFTGVRIFSIGFPFYGTESISVRYRASADTLTPFTPLTAGVDFTVTGVRAGSSDSDIAFKSGSITLTDAGVEKLQNGYQVLITRETPVVQQYAYNELDNFPAKSHENALGRLTVIAQELQNKARSAVTIPPGSGESGEDVLADILDAANRAEGAADDAATSAQEAKDAAATINPDNLVAIDNTQWGMDAIGMDFYGESDKGRVPVVDQNGERLVFKDPVTLLAGEEKPTFRNTILAGKNKDGQPAFLIGQDWLRTPQKAPANIGPLGIPSASSENDANTYHHSRPFANQVVYSGGFWQTPSGTTTGWVDYYYNTPFVPTGANILPSAAGGIFWPTSFTIEGFNESTQTWDSLYSNAAFKQQHATIGNNVGLEYGTTVWFTNNTTAYRRVRYRVLSSTGTAIILQTIRFFTCEHMNLSPFDAVIDASPEHPLKVSIAKGQYGDKIVTIDRPILLPGTLFYEMARNYLYAVPQNEDGTAPDYIDEAHAVHVPDAGVWLWVSPYKIDYSATIDELRSKSLLVFQSHETTNRTVATNEVLRANTGYWDHELLAAAITSDITKGHRGAPSSWKFGTSASSQMYTQTLYAQTLQPTANTQPGAESFTLEMDFAYTGPDENTAGYYILFDAGTVTSGNSTFNIRYDHQQDQIRIGYSNSNALFAFPFVATRDKWYNLSVCVENHKMFLHIDGKCVGFYNAVPPGVSGTNNYMIGRWMNFSTNQFPGYINNIHYILGTSLRQSEDYEVLSTFYEDAIPHNTVWWNYQYGCVQKYSQIDKKWTDTPMLAIGHIDTGNKEHLHTWQPRGTNRTYSITAVKEFTTNGFYSATYAASGASNFGEGGDYPYITPSGTANNTTAYWCMLELNTPMAISELRAISTGSNAWSSFLSVFKWEASQNGTDWTTLVDRSAFVRDGNPNLVAQHFLGNVHNVNGMKRFVYANSTRYRYYRITLLPKGAVPLYAGTYTAFRALFILDGATPEIESVQPYVIRDTYAAPVFMVIAGTDYVIPVPFGGIPFDARSGSYVVELNDFEKKRRPLGQMVGWESTGYKINGEILYHGNDFVKLSLGNYYVSLHNGGTYNSRSVNRESSYANTYIIARRLY